MGSKKNYGGSHDRDGHHDRDERDHHGDGSQGITQIGTKGDNVLTGTDRNDKLFGGKGDDKLFGLAGNDKLDGGKGNDAVDGGAGNDLLIGAKGNDSLQGGADDDTLYGDQFGKGWAWGWDHCLWWTPQSGDADFLDGGAGNDKVFAGRGDDIALYSMAGNLGANFADIGTHDVYEGGSGFDTLQLALTYGEFRLASVQEDITAFQAFLADKADPRSDHGKTFHFQSFDLDARNFEALVYELVNTAPTAHADAAATNEDTPRVIAAPGLLANDTDPDHLDVLAVTGADATSALGAVVLVGPDGSISYDPTAALALQKLAEGTTTTDSFSYTIADLAGATSTATVQVAVTGVNDAPVADDDLVTLPVSGGSGPTEVTLLEFTEASNSTPIVSDGYQLNGFFGASPASGSKVAAVDTGTGMGGDPDGTVVRLDGEDFAVLSVDIALLRGAQPVTIVGYKDGSPVDDLSTTTGLSPEIAHLVFGTTWSGIDELRFDVAVTGDFLLIDNLRLAFGEGDGGGEATPINIDVLDNDTDVDFGDSLFVSAFDAVSAMGAAISRNLDGTLHYDPSGADLPTLAPGETATDTFEYIASDGKGGTDVASVSVALLGVDEAVQPFTGSLLAPDVDLL